MLISEEYDYNFKLFDFLYRFFIVLLIDREDVISYLIVFFIIILIFRVFWFLEYGLSNFEIEWIFLFYKSIYFIVLDKIVCNLCSIIIYII